MSVLMFFGGEGALIWDPGEANIDPSVREPQADCKDLTTFYSHYLEKQHRCRFCLMYAVLIAEPARDCYASDA